MTDTVHCPETVSSVCRKLPGRAVFCAALVAGACSTTTHRLPGLPVHPAELLWIGFLALASLQGLRERWRNLPALPWLLVLLLVGGASGVAHAPSAGRGVAEWGQLACQCAVPVFVLGILPALGRPLALGLAVGLAGNAACAVGQRLNGVTPLGIAGLAGNRLLLAGLTMALTPLVLRLLASRRRLFALAATTLAVLQVALPQELLALAAWLVVPWRSLRRQTRYALLVVLLGGAAVHRAELKDFVRWRDPDGTPRRWVQELVAAKRAVRERPLLGHGFGNYQAVVSSGHYRDELARPLETRVEPGRQVGYLVLAVEGGLPLAVLVGAVLLWAGWRGWRGATPCRRAAGLACWGLALAFATTPMFVRGPGFAVGSLLALALLSRPSRRSLLPQLLVLCAALAAAFLARGSSADPAATAEVAPVLPAPESATVLLAAGQPAAMPEWAGRGAEGGLEVRDGVLEAGKTYPAAIYPFALSEPATVVVWLRAYWEDGCGNSIAVGFGDETPHLVGNDGTYHAWHWVRGIAAELAAGQHELRLHPREDGLSLDQILITSDTNARPFGRLGEGGHSAAPVVATLPQPPPALVPRARPFRFGIGGCYRGGFEAALLGIGLPWGKVNDYDLVDPARLREHDVLCLSELKEVDASRCFAALESFVREGGILIWENHNGPVPGKWQSDQTLLPCRVRWRLRPRAGGCALVTDASAVFAGIEPNSTIQLHDQVPVMRFRDQPGAEWKSYGKLRQYGRDVGAAIYERSLDRGRVYFLSLPLSFHTMWKGRQFLPILDNLLTQMAGAQAPPVHPQLSQGRPAREGTWFGDDFMRAGAALGGGWTASGQIRCTGEGGNSRRAAFSAQAEGPAEMTAGVAEWSDYRLSAAVRVEHGRVGLRADTRSGMPVELAWDAVEQRLCLRQGQAELASGSLPSKGQGTWRRLSLFGRGNAWYAFADGQCQLRVETDHVAGLVGSATISIDKGEAFIDDVAVCPVTALVENSDRALGEEGSPAAWGGLGQHGIERHTIYSMPWLARPSAAYEHAVELSLPTYREAVLRYDNGPGLLVPPSPDPPVVSLPSAPQQWLAVAAPDWRDYVFPGRVTEWTPRGGDWIPLSRWSCDPEWHWIGTETTTRSALWYDRVLAPPYAVNAVLSLGARSYFREEYDRGRDLNLQLGGNGESLDRGISIRVMNCRDRGVELWQDGKRIAQVQGVGMPSGHTLHHNWYEVGAWVEANRVRVRFEGVTVLDQKLDTPLAPGRLAVWTERNSIRVGRVTIAGGDRP